MRQTVFLGVCLTAGLLRADIVNCACDIARPETLEARQCSLCREAEKQPPDVQIFVLKDTNPTKPNRWLVLPRNHARSLDQLSAAERLDLFSRAITKARTLFPENWAIAYNAPQVQTQCHVHLHLGKLIPGVETEQFLVVNKVDEIPAPAPGEGYWIHPAGNALHVHTGEQITETVLLR